MGSEVKHRNSCFYTSCSETCSWLVKPSCHLCTKPTSFHLHLITDRAHHCVFFHFDVRSHLWTLATILAKFSGSDFMMESNSTNLPGRKNTLVTPKRYSFSVIPSAFSNAWQTQKYKHNKKCQFKMSWINENRLYNVLSWD
jgi:hypothetical protein